MLRFRAERARKEETRRIMELRENPPYDGSFSSFATFLLQ